MTGEEERQYEEEGPQQVPGGERCAGKAGHGDTDAVRLPEQRGERRDRRAQPPQLSCVRLRGRLGAGRLPSALLALSHP